MKPKIVPILVPHAGRRHDSWPSLFHDLIKSRRQQPFQWGTNDCAVWVVDCIRVVTGVDLYGEFRGQYNDAKSAFMAIRRITGGKTVEDVAVHCFDKAGIPELKHPNFAQRGDIVCFDQRQPDGTVEPLLGVMNLCGQVALFVSDKGLLSIPVAKCRRAWRIGGVHPEKKELKVATQVAGLKAA
jgi:hypothetical protein